MHTTCPCIVNIRSHCVSLGFSDAKQANFQSECATIDDEEFHNEGCDHCDLIPKLFIVIEGLHNEAEKDIEDVDFHENLFDLKKAEKQIKDYIGFVHRNKMQGSFWKNLMAQNLSHLVFYIGDFAMKWIPRPHRETQSQWFGKSGVPWHIGVFLRIIMMNGIPMIETEGHISVLDDDSIQDSNTVLALMKVSFAVYKKAHPEVTELTICSDCAGAYRNEKVIVGLWSLRN